MRKLGRTGAVVTMLGLGGSHIGDIATDAEAQKTIEAALAGGVRFFDTAAAYQRGGSETRLGKLLTPKYRDVIFLMSKCTSTSGAAAKQQLQDTLSRLNVDYLDLWQMHTLHSAADAESRIKQGVLDVFLDAQRRGIVRYIGFTGHVTPESHLHMLDLAKARGEPFQTCQMPINIADPNFDSFTVKVLPKAVERGFGVCGMKSLANGGFTGRGAVRLIPDRVSFEECLHFVWSLPVSVVISGCTSAAQITQNINSAKNFKPLDEAARNRLIALAAPAGKAVEYYKG
jgi:aryl-alcohol dehydrogenase-like predicted oxidoreductase